MYEFKENGKVFTSKFVGTGPLSCEKRICRAAVSQRLRNTALKPYSCAPGEENIKKNKKHNMGRVVVEKEQKMLVL